MKYTIFQDENGTHLSWQLEGVTPKMIDWFWSNMEKCFLLWHPEEHQPLSWAIPPKHGNLIGVVHLAPQTWSDGTFQNLYIRFEALEKVPLELKKYVEYGHCIIVAGLGFGPESLNVTEPMGYRIHQWQKTYTDEGNTYDGVVGKSSAFGWEKTENHEQGMVWAKHAAVEISNWGAFLPTLYNLYKVVKNTTYNPFTDLTVEGENENLKYKYQSINV